VFSGGHSNRRTENSAMESIRELDRRRAASMAAAVLYVDYADNLDSCIAIRTIEFARRACPIQPAQHRAIGSRKCNRRMREQSAGAVSRD